MKKLSPKKSSGKIKNVRKVDYEGILFDSKLERFTYQQLIENDIKDFKYAEITYDIIDKFEYNAECYELKNTTKEFILFSNNVRAIKYTPDFVRIDEKTKEGWIIETKGFANESFVNRWKLFKRYLVNNGYNVRLYKPNNQKNVMETINLIKQQYYEN